jgi:putative ABC transport system permease protein
MKPRKLGQLAWQGLALHKLRSTLSALGIVFGVAAVVAMMSVGEGARREILAEVGRFGITRVTVRAGTVSGDAEQEARALQSAGLTVHDARAITEVCPTVLSLAPLRARSVQISSSERRAEALFVATTPSYARTIEMVVAQGRFLADADVTDGKRVIVLGHELSRSLFPYRDPLGGQVRVDEEWFTVVGALEARERTKRGSRLGGRDVNRMGIVPISAYPAPGGRVDEISIRISDAEVVSSSAHLIDSVLTRRHRGARDFELVVPKELLAGYERARFQFNVVVGAVAAISLVVGGIGIMNIMLANVSERTREIGIRRSLGASRSDIVQQFIAEALMLTGAGGALGIIVGFLASLVVSYYAGWPTALSLWALLAALTLAASTGLGFGLYPAWQAAGKNPVEALRHE